MKHRRLCLFLCLFLMGTAPSFADTQKPAPLLLTLEWPPHTSSHRPDGGEVSRRVKAAYASLGEEARIGFFPWYRAMRLSYSDPRFIGFFPAYPSAERRAVCHLSAAIGESEVRLAQLRQHPLIWTRPADLGRYRIGIVRAYANQEEFDLAVKREQIRVRIAESDQENLLNLVQGRVDGVVIDTAVYAWLIANVPALRMHADTLELQEKTLARWPLSVCFRRDAEGERARDRFNAGLAASSAAKGP